MMAQAVVRTDALLALITGFGENVLDLRLTVKDNKLSGAVGMTTHFCSKGIPVIVAEDTPYHAGDILVPDVAKAAAFLKASKEKTTSLRHVGNVLTLRSGSNEFSTPSHNNVLSHQSVGRAQLALAEAQSNNWTKLGRANLEVHGVLNMGDLHGLATMSKVTGKDSPVRIRIEDGEMVITAGNERGARMSRTIDVDVKDGDMAETVFGGHLPRLLHAMPSGDVLFHMGNRSALVLRHGEQDAMLVLMHQEGVR
jgi:hypothetical protein